MNAVLSDRGIWIRPWFPLAQLGWTAVAGAAWYLFPQLGPWPMVVGLSPWLVRLVATGYAGHRTPFDVPLLVFLVTAGVSLWAAYDPSGSRAVFETPIGRHKLWGLILAVLVFYSVTEFSTQPQRWWLLLLLTGFGAAVAVWFIATNDWDANPALWKPLTRLGKGIQSAIPPVAGHRLSPNVAGGLTALVLPMGLELVAGVGGGGRGASGWETGRRRWGAAVLGGLWASLMGLGLLLSSSRGAWLGVAAALLLAVAWWLARRVTRGRQRLTIFVGFVAGGVLLSIAMVTRVPFLRSMVLGSQALSNRLSISYQALHLVRDYLFTGCGLGHFPLVHSTYVLLIHVPEMVFAHSTPLDVAVEQGMIGALALGVVWIGAAWIGTKRLVESDEVPPGLVAGLLSLTVLMFHGAFDSTIYGSRALLLFWLPAGLILAASEGRKGGVTERDTEEAVLPGNSSARSNGRGASDQVGTVRSGGWGRRAAVTAAALVFVALLVGLWRPLAASWYANLGAVQQTLAELRAYDYEHFDDPTLDEVRQQVDLSRALVAFQRAIALDRGQVTARTRLAQIALARGEYDGGLDHVLAAWEAGYRDRVTRLVLGDALVAQGRVEEAAAVVRGLERAESRLDGQAFSRYARNGDWQRAAYAWRTVLALDPGNERVREAAERAEARARDE